jgi:hypothetical protein
METTSGGSNGDLATMIILWSNGKASEMAMGLVNNLRKKCRVMSSPVFKQRQGFTTIFKLEATMTTWEHRIALSLNDTICFVACYPLSN